MVIERMMNMLTYAKIKEAQQSKHVKECSGCTKQTTGYPMGIWQGQLQLRFACNSCGTVTEYVNVNSPNVTTTKSDS